MTLIEDLTQHFTNGIWELPAHAIIIRQGGWYDSMFVILDGSLEVWNERDDRTERVGTIAEGGVLGEVSLFAPGAATATVRTAGPCRALRLEHVEIDRLWDEQPALARRVLDWAIGQLAGRMREATDRMRGTDGAECSPWI